MLHRKKILLACAAACAALLLFCVTLLPGIVKSRLVEAIQKATGRTARLESVSINPLTLSVSMEGFVMEERGGGHFISIGALRASLSPASLYRRALVLSRIRIERPRLHIVRTGPNSYNFSDIQQRLQTEKKPEEKGDTRFSLNNITVTGGSIDFNDRAVPGGRLHTVRNLEIGIPFISNIPYLVEEYTAPRISAQVNGAPFGFAGRMKPLSASMETSVRIDLKGLDLPRLVAYAPQKPPASLKSGKLTIDTELSYRVYANRKPELIVSGLTRLDNAVIDTNNGAPLLRLPSMEARAGRLEFFAGLFRFSSIRVQGLELFLSRDRQGTWVYEQLFSRNGSGEKPATREARTEKQARKPGSSFLVSSFSLANGAIHVNDALPPGGFRGALSHINLDLKNVGTIPGQKGEYRLSLLADQGATGNSTGNFSLAPLTLKSSTALKGFTLNSGWPYLASYLNAPLRGVVDLSADLTYDAVQGLKVEKGSAALKDLSTRYGRGDGLKLALLSVEGLSYDQKGNSLEVDNLSLSRGSCSLTRESDGTLSPQKLLKQPGAPPRSGKPVRTAAPSASRTRPLSYRLKRFQTDGINLAFTDKGREGSPRFTLRNTSLSLSDLTGPKFGPAQLRCSTTYGRRSPLKVRGSLTPLPFRFRGTVRIGRLPITDFAPYFPDSLNFSILSGYLDGSLGLDISLKNGTPSGSFRGNAGIRSFHSVDAEAEQDLLRWESLQLDQFQGRLEPFSLSIRQIALNGVYSRVIVRKDGTLNLQNLVDGPASNATAGKTPPAAAAPATTPRTKRQISIGAITIQEGTIAFSDHHLPQDFSSTFHNLGGRISGMSSEESRFADVDLRGNLENRSPLLITGTINPLRDDLFVDLKIAFKDIELSPATPYSGTYLGYSVERGKLSLDLKYHIEQKQLSSENRIFIDQFTFGNRVESQKATKLPVRLGLALLKDRKGEIHLDVPVTGRTDDPQFSIWRLVFQVLKNLMVKAATSPVALLSSMFGDGTDLSTIQFAPGSSALAPAEQQKLATLAKALADRPALKMELKGYVDREKDAEGYRRELLERKIANEQALSLARRQRAGEQGAASPATAMGPEEYSRLLKQVYRREKFPKPRTMFGLIKELPDEEMKKLIVANTTVGEQELQTLAGERSSRVMSYLVGQGVATERIFLKKDNIHRNVEKNGQTRSRVELNAIAP